MASNTSCGVALGGSFDAARAVPTLINAARVAILAKNNEFLSFTARISIVAVAAVGRLTSLLFDAPQQKGGADKGDDGAGKQNYQVLQVKRRWGLIHIHQPERAAKMGERKNFRKILDGFGQLLERGEGARQDKYRQQKKDGELDRLRLGFGESGDKEPEPERTKQKEETDQHQRGRLIEWHVKLKTGDKRDHYDDYDRDA